MKALEQLFVDRCYKKIDELRNKYGSAYKSQNRKKSINNNNVRIHRNSSDHEKSTRGQSSDYYNHDSTSTKKQIHKNTPIMHAWTDTHVTPVKDNYGIGMFTLSDPTAKKIENFTRKKIQSTKKKSAYSDNFRHSAVSNRKS